MTITTHILLGSATGSESTFAFHCTSHHRPENAAVTLTGSDGKPLWEGKLLGPLRELAEGSYLGVAIVRRTDNPTPKRRVDGDGDPIPVTVTVGEEPSSPIEPIVVILDP